MYYVHIKKYFPTSISFSRGATLLDTMVGVSLLLVVFLGLFGAFQLSLQIVESIKSRTGALALAHERIEYIRSLQYDDVGVLGGIPAGILLSEENEVFNNIAYTTRTFVQYVDAPEDGLGASDGNGITADYKTVKATVEWIFRNETRSFSLITSIVPPGIESIVGGGTLRINVLDANGGPVPSAQVSIVNNATTPAVSFSTFTGVSGTVEFPGTPAANSYEISVEKSGYSSAQTYDVTVANPGPSPGHLTVVEDQTTTSTFSIDLLGSITVQTFEVGTTTPLTNIPFTLTGAKTIGVDASENPIYKYTNGINTGGSGSVTTSSLEWDNYTLSIDDVSTGWDIAESCLPQPLSLSPGESETVQVYLSPNVAHSLLVDVKDSNGAVLSNASIRLYRSGYDTTQSSGSCGQTFFNNSLSSGTVAGGNEYSIDVSLAGYVPQTVSNVEVSGASRSSIILTAL